MASKIITLDEHFYTGEPTVQLVSTWGRNGRLLRESTSLHKVASVNSPALDYIQTVEPEPGRSIVLVVGLGDHETYGPNRNGDGFPSEAIAGKISDDQTLDKHYKSYEDALVFEHHANTDPEKAIGRVKKAFWNPHMRRVEVLEDFDHSKAPHLLEKIASGEKVAKSMGCVPAGTMITTAYGRVPVEDIAVGDKVITHRGREQMVTELHRRAYRGKLYSVRTAVSTVITTTEHPFAVLPAEEVLEPAPSGKYFRRRPLSDIDPHHVHWISAEALETGMFLVTPFDAEVEETLTTEQCRFLGYYAAEGYTYHSSGSGVVFTHHEENVVGDNVNKLGESLGYTTTQHKHSASNAAKVTRLASADMARLCDTHVVKGAHQKKLSLALMRQPKEQQLAFLGAYINGDGGAKTTGDYYISTCNKELAHQLQTIGFRCGLYSKINTLRHKPSSVVKKHTTEYQVSFTRKGSSIIAPYTVKVAAHQMKGPTTGPFIVGNAVVSRIKDISVLDADGDVYNFEVDEDESYVADGIATHNCRIKYDVCTICGNRAKTRADYCDHLKYEMNKIYPNGKQAAALNPSPDFFDSSWVIRPADRTGYLLKKVAREERPYEVRTASFDLGQLAETLQNKAAQIRKAAEIEKIIAGEPEASVSSLTDGDKTILRRYNSEIAKPAMDGVKPLPSKAIKIMIEYTPSEVSGTLDSLNIPASITNVLNYVFKRMGGAGEIPDEVCDSVLKHASLVYDIYSKYPRFLEEMEKTANIGAPVINQKLARDVTEWLADEIVGENFGRLEKEPRTKLLNYRDPVTGKRYQTTVGAARQSESDLYKHKLKTNAPLVAAGMLAAPVMSPLAMPVGAALAAKGVYNVATGDHGPTVRSSDGTEFSAYTAMAPKTAALAPELDYLRVRNADNKVGTLSYNQKQDILAQIKTAEIHDEKSALLGPTLDLDKVCDILGKSVHKHLV